MTSTSTHVERLLVPLRESIINKLPYFNGTLQLPPSSSSLFYRIPKDGRSAIHIDLSRASFDELEQLAQATEPIPGESAGSGKMDVECFAPALVPVQTSLKKIIKDYCFEGAEAKGTFRIELQSLNVYSKGSSSKPHVDARREPGVFGSLIIVFPTPHEGGTLLVRNGGHLWSFDHSKELATAHEPSIGYIAVFYDTEHEVSPVISGHCVTLTYKLYFDERKPVPGKDLADLASERLKHPTPLPNEHAFREAFEALLENQEFLADGGTLGFGLRHVYPIKDDLKHVYGLLKGSDSIVYRSAQALGFEPILYVLYEFEPPWMKSIEGGLIDRPIDFEWGLNDWGLDITKVVRSKGGIVVCQDPDSYKNESGAYDKPETVEWITPKTSFNDQKNRFLTMGNEPGMGIIYGNVCLVVRIGKSGERLAYPTCAQLEEVWKREGNRKPSAFWGRY